MKVSQIFRQQAFYASLLAAVASLLSSCASTPGGHIFSGEGSKFNKALSVEIRAADKIEVIEHSHWDDFSNTDVDRRKAPEYVYARRTLSAVDRENFASQVQRLSGVKRVYDHEGCLLVPHYTIQFYKAGKKSGSLELCFKCDDLQWKNGPELAQSKNIIPALKGVVKKAGFNPSIDWKKRASSRYASDQRKKLEREKEHEAEKEKLINPIRIPVAKPVPGKAGFVFNPFTHNQVDVEGIPSGTKVIDPQDAKKRIFKLP